MTGSSRGRGAARLLPLLALSRLQVTLGQELPPAAEARRLSMESQFTADMDNPEGHSSAGGPPDPASGMSNQASQIVSGVMESFLHKNELEPGELECLVNASSQFAGQMTSVSAHTVGLMQMVLKTTQGSSAISHSTDDDLLESPTSGLSQPVNDQAGDISSIVDQIENGQNPQASSGGGEDEYDGDFDEDAPASQSSSSMSAADADQELGMFYGGGRRLASVNPAALAMSTTFVGMQLAATMQQMTHLAHEVVKKCVHADALAAFQLAGKHMRSLKYMQGRFQANGKEIAVELANATKAYENGDPHEFGRNIGKALRKVLLSNTNSTDLPEGPPDTAAMANLSSGLIEGFFGQGAAVDVKSSKGEYAMPLHVDLHACMKENVKFFQQVWAESLWLFAQEDLEGNPITNISASQKKAQFGTAVAFSMMQLPSALKQCNLGDDEQEMLMDSIKAMGHGTSFKFTWPDGTLDKDEVANKMADSVKAWSDTDYHTIGMKLGRLLQEFAVKAYPQKYALDGFQLKSLLPKGQPAKARWTVLVVPGLVASLFASLLALRMVRSSVRGRPAAADWDPEDQASDSGIE